MTARNELYVSIPCGRVVIQTALRPRQVVPVPRSPRSNAITLIQQPLIYHPSTVLAADVADHSASRRVRVSGGRAGVGGTGYIRLLIAALCYLLKLSIVEKSLPNRTKIIHEVHPVAIIRYRPAVDRLRTGSGAGLKINVNPNASSFAPHHALGRALRPVLQIPHRSREDVASSEP